MSIGVPTEGGVAARPGAARRRRPSPSIALSLLFVGAVAILAITGTLLAPHDPSAQNLVDSVQGPSGAHLLGTDDSGRDIVSRIVAGARTAVIGPLAVVLGAMLIGTAFGLLAGYRGGWPDSVIMRVVDLMYALPGLLVAIVLLGVLGGGYWVAVAVLIALTVPYDTRLVRGATLEQRGLPYVDAAQTVGRSPWRIMLRHIWPNILPLVVANAFLNYAFTLVALASLSFLGLGAGPGAAEWGQMLSDNLQLIQDNAWAALAPGIALVLLAMSTNLIGDWVYELMSDRGRGR